MVNTNIISSWDVKVSLRQAVEANDIKALKAILKEHPGFVDARYESGLSPLMMACAAGQREIIETLIAAGADLNAESDRQQSPIFYAIEHKHADIATLLAQSGADPNQFDHNGYTPLYEAFSELREQPEERLSLMNVLIEKGANINAEDRDKDTLLMRAAGWFSDTEIVRMLLARGADVSKMAERGKSALMQAAEYGNLEIALLLLEKGANINQKATMQLSKGSSTSEEKAGWTALMFAVEAQQTAMIELLLARGADVNVQTSNDSDCELWGFHAGRTALHLALEKGFEQITNRLCHAGADLKLKDAKGVSCGALLKKQAKKKPGIDHDFSWQMAKNAKPLTPKQWQKVLQNHQEFLAQNGAEGRWQTLDVSGLPLSIYQKEGLSDETRKLQLILRNHNLTGLTIKDSEISYSDLTGTWGESIDFSKSALSGSCAVDSYLPKALFKDSDVSNSDFSRSFLVGASFVNAKLRGTDFERCDLSNADFTGADLAGVKLKNVVLTGARGLPGLAEILPVPEPAIIKAASKKEPSNPSSKKAAKPAKKATKKPSTAKKPALKKAAKKPSKKR